MLQNKQNILILIVLVLVGYNIFTTNRIKNDIKSYETKINFLQTKIDSAQIVNTYIDTKIDSVKENVVSITRGIHHIDNNISIIKQQTNEKASSVDSFTSNELEQFFTDRYDKDPN